MREILEVEGDICCVTSAQKSIELSIECNGRSEKVVAPMPKESFQPTAPKRAG